MRKSPMNFSNRFETRQGPGVTLFDVSKHISDEPYTLYGHPLGSFYAEDFFPDDASAATDAGMDPSDGVHREGEIGNHETPWRLVQSGPDPFDAGKPVSVNAPKRARRQRTNGKSYEVIHTATRRSSDRQPVAIKFSVYKDGRDIDYVAPYPDEHVDELIRRVEAAGGDWGMVL